MVSRQTRARAHHDPPIQLLKHHEIITHEAMASGDQFEPNLALANPALAHEEDPDSMYVEQDGVIHYPVHELHLCTSVTDAPYNSTTEVYPDSDKVTDADCNAAQVAAVRGALDHVLAQ